MRPLQLMCWYSFFYFLEVSNLKYITAVVTVETILFIQICYKIMHKDDYHTTLDYLFH